MDGGRDKSSLCYKDGPQLPPLNFSTACIKYGRYVTFYNERLPGVTYPDGYVVDHIYTELCEVTVHGKKKLSILLSSMTYFAISTKISNKMQKKET